MNHDLEAGVRLAPPTYGAARSPTGNGQVLIFDETSAQLVERDEARALSTLGNGKSKFEPDDHDDDWLIEVGHVEQADDRGAPGNGKALESLIGKQLIDWNKSFMGFQSASGGV